MMLLTCHSYTTNNLNYNYYIFVKSFDLDDNNENDFIDDINDIFVLDFEIKHTYNAVIYCIVMIKPVKKVNEPDNNNDNDNNVDDIYL